MTDRNPQEGPSFRTGLDGSPLILVVQFTGVHGNKGIIINTGFKFSHEEWKLRGSSLGTRRPGQGPTQPWPPRVTTAHGRWVDPGAVLAPASGPVGRGRVPGRLETVSPATEKPPAPVGAELIYQKQAEGQSPQALPAHSRGAC